MNTHTRYLTAAKSSAEKRWDRTTWVRLFEAGERFGERFMAYCGPSRTEDEIRRELMSWATVEFVTISDGPCEGVVCIEADGEPFAWLDEPPHSFTTDEVASALARDEIAEAAE
jgi:hypothetical protein